MTKSNEAEVIIIGAGLAGLSCAKVLADKGIKTIILERDENPGTKNFYSGILSKDLVESIFGKITFEFERFLTEFRSYFLDDEIFTLASKRENKAKDFIVLREKANAFMLERAKKAGVNILCRTVVRNLIIEDEKITGVKTDEKKLFGNIAVIAEGMPQILTKTSGLRRGELTPDQVFIFLEENIILPAEIIEERLNLEKGINQGLAAKFFGQFKSFGDLNILGYFYTNKNSITIGSGALLKDLIERAVNINECQEKIKSHPAIRQILKGGSTNHYSSYILPAYGKSRNLNLPKSYGKGYVLAGGAAMLINPYSFDISELAITSGKIAGETIIRAKSLNDYSEGALSFYEKISNEHSLVKELKNQEKSEIINEAQSKDKLNTLCAYVLQEEK